MIRYLCYLCFLMPFFFNPKQSQSKPFVIRAGKFTQLLKNEKGVVQWQVIHSLPTGTFVCRVEPNGNLRVNFGSKLQDNIWIVSDMKDGVRDKFKPVINGFKLLGVYSDANPNNTSINAVYFNFKRPNSLLVLFEVFPGSVVGVTYYTDEMTNPFEKLNLLTKEGAKIKVEF